MTYEQFLEEIINRGIAGAERDYAKDPIKLRGAVHGFLDCKEVSARRLPHVLSAARIRREEARKRNDPLYWEYRTREAEVEWVCNVVSAYGLVTKQPVFMVSTTTARGVIIAATILGLQEPA